MRIKLIILCCFLSVLAKAQIRALDTAAYTHTVATVQNKHYITSWSQIGSFDTVIVKSSTVLSGNFLSGVGGTAAHHWVVINEGGPVYTNGGLDNYDIHYIDFLGYGTSDPYGFIFNAQTAGFAFPLKGKSHHIRIYGVILNGGTQEGFTAKIEASDWVSYHFDTSVARFIQNNLYWENCKVRFNGGESWYINSTGWFHRDQISTRNFGNGAPFGITGTFESSDIADNITNTATATNYIYADPLFVDQWVSIKSVLTRVSGTVAGKIILKGSNDNITYTPIDSQTLVDNASQAYSFTYTTHGWNYFKVFVNTTGTVSAKLNSYLDFYFNPPSSDSINITKSVSIAPGRSAINFDNLTHSSVTYCKFWHLGRGLESSQGRAVAGAKWVNPVITDCQVFGSYVNNFWIYGEGIIDFERNYGDSADFYSTVANPQQNAAFEIGISAPRKDVPTTWIIKDNEFYHGSGGGGTIQYILYPGPNMTNANVVCNNIGNVSIDKTFPFSYSNNCGSSNLPPTVNAGNDTTITLPATTINLNGSATAGTGSLSSTTWSNADGCSITSASSLTTTATCSTSGDHIFTLTATNSVSLTSTDQMVAHVNAAANIPPVAIAQNDTVVFEPIDTLMIHQNATDADGTIAGYNTFLISSHYGATVQNFTSQTPTISGLQAGDTIVLKLKVIDNNGASANDTTTIIVKADSVNHAPVPQINKDTSIEYRLPVSQISIDASSSYDPDKGDYIAAYYWEQISGDTGIQMTGINASVLSLNGLDTGVYKFRLTVTDTHGATSSLNFSVKGLMVLRFKIGKPKQKTTSFKPLYGALWANYSTVQKVQGSRLFGMKENRVAVDFPSWNGTNSPVTDQLVDSGQLVSLNIREANYSDTTHFSNVDLTAYRTHVNTLMNNINADSVLVVQGNEADALAYHVINDSTDLAPNIAMASIVARAAAAKGIESANGGLMSSGVVYTTYRFLSDTHDADTTDFLHYCIPVNRWSQVVNRSNPDVEAMISNDIYLLRRYDTIPFTFGNAHMYFPSALRMNDTATNWRADYTGIAQITRMLNYFLHNRLLNTDEFGIVTNVPDSKKAEVASYVITDLKRFNYIHQDYWNDPTSTKVSPISNAGIVLTTLGSSYKNDIQ